MDLAPAGLTPPSPYLPQARCLLSGARAGVCLPGSVCQMNLDMTRPLSPVLVSLRKASADACDAVFLLR